MARIGPNANPRRQWNIQRPHQDSDKAWKLTQEQGDVFRNHHVQVPCEFSGQKRVSNKEVAIWYTVHSCVQTYVRKWLDVIITAICLCKDLWFALSLVSVQLGILLEWDSENPSVCCDFKGLSAGKNKKNNFPCWPFLPSRWSCRPTGRLWPSGGAWGLLNRVTEIDAPDRLLNFEVIPRFHGFLHSSIASSRYQVYMYP